MRVFLNDLCNLMLFLGCSFFGIVNAVLVNGEGQYFLWFFLQSGFIMVHMFIIRLNCSENNRYSRWQLDSSSSQQREKRGNLDTNLYSPLKSPWHQPRIIIIIQSTLTMWKFLPIYRVGSLFGRVFTRPVITYMKSIHLANTEGAFRILSPSFIRLGHYYHSLETSLNERFKVDKTSEGLQALSDQLALQKGIDFYYQIVIYSLLIFFSLIEVQLLYRKGNERKSEINIRLEEIRIKTAILKQIILSIEKDVSSISNNYKQQIYELESKLSHLADQNRFHNYVLAEKAKSIKKRNKYEGTVKDFKDQHFKIGLQKLMLL